MVTENLFVFILLRYVFVVFTYFTHELTANQLFRNQNFNIENLLFLFVQAVIAKKIVICSPKFVQERKGRHQKCFLEGWGIKNIEQKTSFYFRE